MCRNDVDPRKESDRLIQNKMGAADPMRADLRHDAAARIPLPPSGRHPESGQRGEPGADRVSAGDERGDGVVSVGGDPVEQFPRQTSLKITCRWTTKLTVVATPCATT